MGLPLWRHRVRKRPCGATGWPSTGWRCAPVLVDVSSVDRSTTFLGHRPRIPVMLAPIGGLQNFDPDGGVAVARAAHAFGTLPIVSSATLPTLEETAAASESPKIFSSTSVATGHGSRA